MKGLLPIFSLLAIGLSAYAQKVKEVANAEVPQAVKDAFHTESTSEAPKKWTMRTLANGQIRYIAWYTDAMFNARLAISAQGKKINRVYVGVENGSFNEICDQAALKKYPSYSIKSHESIFVFAKEKTLYRNILGQTNQKRVVFLCDGNGKPITGD